MESIKSFFKEIRPEFDFDDSKNFIEDGYLDSFDVITLVSMIEEKFGIRIDGLDIVPENFCSYETIKNMISNNGGKIWKQFFVTKKFPAF